MSKYDWSKVYRPRIDGLQQMQTEMLLHGRVSLKLLVMSGIVQKKKLVITF